MKLKLLSLLVAGGIAQQASAQVLYSETFSHLTLVTNVTNVPAGMKEINVGNKKADPSANNAPFNVAPNDTKGWLAAAATFGGVLDTAAECTSWITPAGAVDKWLITPKIANITANSVLLWDAIATDPAYADGYEVWISTTSSTDPVPADFTGTPSNKVFTIAAETNVFTKHAVSLAAFAGQNVYVAFRNKSNDKFHLYIDDITVMNAPDNDAALTQVMPAAGSSQAFAPVGSNVLIGGVIYNAGTQPITSIVIKYSDGTNTYTDTKTGINIAPFKDYAFSHKDNYNVATGGAHNINVWVELANDANTNNDGRGTVINGVSFMPKHNVTIEEGTGTWCGWCPRGAVFMDSIAIAEPDNVVPIAVHNADPMVEADYDAGVGDLIAGYPSVLVNRNIVADPSEVFDMYAQTKDDFGFADLPMTYTFDQGTRVISADAIAKFAAGLKGDYRLAMVVTEDHVTGTTTEYDQVNYYSFQSQNLALSGAGHNWQTEPNPVVAANMEYNHVARTIVGGFNGQAGSLPSIINDGEAYSYNFTYTMPAEYNMSNSHVYLLLIDAANDRILNGNRGILSNTTFDAAVINQSLHSTALIDTTYTISGTVHNFGSTAINSMDLNYSINNGTVFTDNLTGLNIAYAGNYNFAHSVKWTPTVLGSYTVKIWINNINGGADGNQANDTLTVMVKVQNPVGIATIKNERANINIYPNPSQDVANVAVNFASTEKQVQLRLYNAVGQLVYNTAQHNVNKHVFTVNTVDLASGIYNVQIVAGQNTSTRRLVINK